MTLYTGLIVNSAVLAASEALLRLHWESALGPQINVTANSLQVFINSSIFMCGHTLQDALPGPKLS